MQPITHTCGIFCGGRVVIKNQHLGGFEEGSEGIECHEAEQKLKCSSCGLMNVTDPHFLSVCVMAAGVMGCQMKICKVCHGRKENYGANKTSLCLPKCNLFEVWGNPELGLVPKNCWPEAWVVAPVDPCDFWAYEQGVQEHFFL
jgi:hypothetical protein